MPGIRTRYRRHLLWSPFGDDLPDAVDVRAILEHIGESVTPPRIASARRPPEWWEDSGKEAIDTEADPLAHSEPEYEYDQRVSW